MLSWLFWTALGLLIYTWCGYPAFLMALRRLHTGSREITDYRPFVTVLVTVHNEEKLVVRRIENILASDYPPDLMEVLIASDGSTDATNSLVAAMAAQDKRIKLFTTTGGGKSSTQNRAIPSAQGSVIILSDAEALFDRDTARFMARHFSDAAVGCVSGRVLLRHSDQVIAEGQGLYWQYELMIRRLENETGILHQASGAIMAFRKDAFRRFPDIYGDDCIIPLDMIQEGYRVVHDDEAVAYDDFPATLRGEFKARTRMTLRNITCTMSKIRLMNPFAYGFMSIAIVSHRIFRWLTPYFMLLFLISNAGLLFENSSRAVAVLFILQGVFYMLGAVGFVADRYQKRVPVASLAFSFLLANFGFFWGVLKALMGRRQTSFKNIKTA
jgi:cellulose synthase/poly-beta-1,6-N-acetylglucosamine synthase-like glycosyltransferase